MADLCCINNISSLSPFLPIFQKKSSLKKHHTCSSSTLHFYPHFRFSQFNKSHHHKLFLKLKSSSSSKNSVSSDMALVSTTECSDGSVVFQFGKACEIQEKSGSEVTVETDGGIKVESLTHEEEANTLSYRVLGGKGGNKVVGNNSENMGIKTQVDELAVSIEDNGVAETASSGIEPDYKPALDKQPVQDTVSSENKGVAETASSVIELDYKTKSDKQSVQDTVSSENKGVAETASSVIEPDYKPTLDKQPVQDSVSSEIKGVAETASSVIELDYKTKSDKQPVQDTVSSEDNDITETARNAIEPDYKPTLDKQLVEDIVVDCKESEYIGLGDISSVKKSKACKQNLEMHDTSMAKSEAESEAPLNTLECVSSVDAPTSNAMVTELMNPSLASEDRSMDNVMFNVIGEDNEVGNLGEVIPVSSLVNAEPNLQEEVDCNGIEKTAEAVETESLIMINEDTQTVNSEVENFKDNKWSRNIRDISILSSVELEPAKPSPQREEVSTPGLVLCSGATSLPHPSKGGKDAYFVAGQYWFGVADGIGQWSLEGGNTGLYAQELMENCEKIVSDCNEVLITSSREALTLSAAEAQSPGHSTVLVAQFDGQVLDVASIGDCGFAIIRHGIVFKRSSAKFHELHFPVQIEKGDDPSKLIEEYLIDLDDGDVFVIATDGLFDNLYEQEIASIVTKSLETNLKPKEIAKLLASRAQDVGRSASARSPFADTTQAAGYVGYTGGKLDDVTVIVSLVQSGSN